MILEMLAKRGDKRAAFIMDAFDPDQPRDENGMWTAGGSARSSNEHYSAEKGHASAAAFHEKAGRVSTAKAHREAALAHRYASEKVASDPGSVGEAYSSSARMASERANKASEQVNPKGQTSATRTTQTEIPAVKEAPVALMAPHSQLPVGNTKPKEPIHDLKVTQRLEAQPDIRVERMAGPGELVATERKGLSREEREFHAGLHQANMNRKQDKEQTAFLAKAEARGRSFSPTDRAVRKQYAQQERAEPGAGARMDQQRRSSMTKEGRRDAAAASAGRWASRAVELRASGVMRERVRGSSKEASAHMAEGMRHEQAGRHPEAVASYMRARDLYAKSRGRSGEAATASAAIEELRGRFRGR